MNMDREALLQFHVGRAAVFVNRRWGSLARFPPELRHTMQTLAVFQSILLEQSARPFPEASPTEDPYEALHDYLEGSELVSVYLESMDRAVELLDRVDHRSLSARWAVRSAVDEIEYGIALAFLKPQFWTRVERRLRKNRSLSSRVSDMLQRIAAARAANPEGHGRLETDAQIICPACDELIGSTDATVELHGHQYHLRCEESALPF